MVWVDGPIAGIGVVSCRYMEEECIFNIVSLEPSLKSNVDDRFTREQHSMVVVTQGAAVSAWEEEE